MSFKLDENVLKKNLEHWFKFDNLSPEQGIAILIGIEPTKESLFALANWYGDDRYIDAIEIIKSGIPLLSGDIIGGEENKQFKERHSDTVIENEKHQYWGYDYHQVIINYEQPRFSELVDKYDKRFEIWNSGKRHENMPLLDFIEWANQKTFPPAWLDDSIKFGLYVPKHETVGEEVIVTNNSSTYSTKWLVIQQAAIAEFFYPRRNPDAKKGEVIGWINSQATKAGLGESNNIASTIFTIIKPENHDPKKKRVEPQQSQ